MVTLVNAATGDTIGITERSADSLPETFANGTELAIGDSRWGVVRAEPETRAECERGGELRLTLRELVLRDVDPARIRYSMASICGELPPLEPTVDDGDPALVLHEDLWRDVELVSSRQQAAIDVNLAAVDRIERDAAGAAGYGDIHVRTEPQAPLDGVEIRLDELLARLSGSRLPGGVALSSAGGTARVVDGFAFALAAGSHLYGWAPEDRIRVLAVDGALAGGGDGGVIDELMHRHQLVLVDWQGRQVAR
jgi:hypothetical protein